jgi:hypothetical protein
MVVGFMRKEGTHIPRYVYPLARIQFYYAQEEIPRLPEQSYRESMELQLCETDSIEKELLYRPRTDFIIDFVLFTPKVRQIM